MTPAEIKHRETCKCDDCLRKLHRTVLKGGDKPAKTRETPKEELFGF